ncbi:MAG: hypothetical protein H6811_10770 [Phycisphaeraceae bacterium]|nr:hypothetical protein [Phycisphaeraceae bacterium]
MRSGSHSIELPTVGGQRFLAWTTNVFDPQGDLYDPTYIYLGGPLTVSGWYAIPASDPLVNARAGLKLELRREPPNFSIYLSFERLELQGHTGGQWRYFEFTITDEDIETLEAQWGGPWPPFPTSVSVLPLRFLDPEFSTQSGTIFWDDLRVLQIPNCPADLTGSGDPGSPSYGVPDGRVDIGDFFYFVDQFALRSSVADLTGSDDPQNPAYGVCDGVVDASDFFYYLELFSAGC